MRLGINLPGPFSVSVPLNTNPHAVTCRAGGVVHANGAIASRCQDCRRWYAWAASPGGQEWLRLEQKEANGATLRAVAWAVPIAGLFAGLFAILMVVTH
jgi:hypothetical protein